ncbi:MAG: DUF4011 domain-containing protein [Alphaproteobacteria bacterium]
MNEAHAAETAMNGEHGEERDPHAQYIAKQIEAFRERLLDLSLRNSLLNCRHDPRNLTQLRIVDELPDPVFLALEDGNRFLVAPLPEPRDNPDDEDTEEFDAAFETFKQKSVMYRAALAEMRRRNATAQEIEALDREARNQARQAIGLEPWRPETGLSGEELARRHGINPSFELPRREDEPDAERHRDDTLQTLLEADDLNRRLRLLADRARTSLRDTGVNTLSAALGFLEWYEDDVSAIQYFAPLLMVPLDIGRRREGTRYVHTLYAAGDPSGPNVTLGRFLSERFDLVLPEFEDDDSPESYFDKVKNDLCRHKQRWKVHRFLTIGLFPYSKIAIYHDLDEAHWAAKPSFVDHRSVRNLLAASGATDVPYAEDRSIDEDMAAARTPILIYDADSSQHSAVTDALTGEDLAIYGPPGTGKSQIITNIIAAEMYEGKTVLFVAEKLAALDVVHDRLAKAGLGPYCLNLHAQALRKSEVIASLRERLQAAPPPFDPNRYEQQKEIWTEHRDALRTYARILGERVGQLDKTVHDVLWHVVRRSKVRDELPQQMALLTLTECETLTERQLEAARQAIRRVLQELAPVARDPGGIQGHPWRGVTHCDLSPVELPQALDAMRQWRDALQSLVNCAATLGIPEEPSRRGDLLALVSAPKLLEPHVARLGTSGLATIGNQDARAALRDDLARIDRRIEIAEAVRQVVPELDVERVPVTDLREVLSRASAEAVANLSPDEIEAEAARLVARARRVREVSRIVHRLVELFGCDRVDAETTKSILRATDVIAATPREILLSRSAALIDDLASEWLEAAEKECNALREEQARLQADFALEGLPAAAELHAAARILSSANGPTILSARARRARALYRSGALRNEGFERRAAAEALRRVACFLEARDKFVKDPALASKLGNRWRGLDTNFTVPLSVAAWASRVATEFAGISDGHKAVRHVLLRGSIEELDEVALLARDLANAEAALGVATLVASITEDPAQISARAERLADLASRARTCGLSAERSLEQAQILPDVIDEDARLRELLCASTQLSTLRLTQRQQIVEIVSLCEEMEAYCRDPRFWALAAVLAETPDRTVMLEQCLADEHAAWRHCASVLAIETRSFFDGNEHEDVRLTDLLRRADAAVTAPATLPHWVAFYRRYADVIEGPAGVVLDALQSSGAPLELLSDAFEWALYQSLARRIYRAFPQLTRLDGNQLVNHRESFIGLEAKLLELERARVAYTVHRREVPRGVTFGSPSEYTELGLVQYQVQLQRGSVSLRQLMRRAGNALRQLKPCHLMSPVTVAQLLPRQRDLFDLVIIDEASQVRPEEALGAIARAKQSIIVGDPKQLPPTSFFQASSRPSATTANGADNGVDNGYGMLDFDAESILDLALKAWRPPRHLRWHYRSRHSGLIAFSNKHFYENQLIVFPGPNETNSGMGVHFHYVGDGIYRGHRNAVEAQRLVDEARAFMENPDNRERSLAVVTMNLEQRDLVDEMFESEFASNRAMARYRQRWENTLYPFVVKNLENVQGDERDVIMISTVYGPEQPGGQVAQRFGPITTRGGERRLNVLFTRARERIDVFSSMQAASILPRPNIHLGTRTLRSYLEYAATGRIETGIINGAPTESPFEDHVKTRLEAEGFKVQPQVGVAGYRIDLGVAHLDYPHGFLAGVECDGATYHSAKSVRDRDRLREAILNGLGWHIYRIWSTDWYEDPDREMEKLLGFLLERLTAPDRPAAQARPIEEELIGVTDEEGPGRGADGAVSVESPPVQVPTSTTRGGTNAEEIVVEIGDTVSYRRSGSHEPPRSVTIVTGQGDPARGVINDGTPLAKALLGAARGEEVDVRTPGGQIRIIVEGIEKALHSSDADGETGSWASEAAVKTGEPLPPYKSWNGNAPDPRTAPPAAIDRSLLEIVTVEGPVTTLRASRTYARACGILRVGKQVRQMLNHSVNRLQRTARIKIDGATDRSGFSEAVLRLPESPEVVLRQRGPRAFEEIPLDELSAHFARAKRLGGLDDEAANRAVLEGFGLTRMTTRVREIFAHALRMTT